MKWGMFPIRVMQIARQSALTFLVEEFQLAGLCAKGMVNAR
jgi:hypothetical protein